MAQYRPIRTCSIFLLQCLGAIALTGLWGCSGLTLELLIPGLGRRLRTVEWIDAQPSRELVNTTVQMEGVVGDRAPLLDGQLYELSDDTGSIWVLAPDNMMETGDRVVIQGEIRYESILISGQDFSDVYLQQLRVIERSPQ
jgi:hypothetical protein